MASVFDWKDVTAPASLRSYSLMTASCEAETSMFASEGWKFTLFTALEGKGKENLEVRLGRKTSPKNLTL